MINYEKIKAGKNLTKNQKRLYEVYKSSLLFNKEMTRYDYIKNYEKKQKHEKIVKEFKRVSNIDCSNEIKTINLVLTNNIDYYDIRINEDLDYCYYGGRCNKFAKKTTIIDVLIGRKNAKRLLRGSIGVIDGLLTLHNGKNYELVNIDINNYKKEKIKIRKRKTYIVKKKIGKFFYFAHGDTKEEARKDLIYKIKPVLREIKKNKIIKKINFNTFIGVKLYRLLTGACQQGCQNFADTHKLSINQKLRISDLLKILDTNDYGYYDIFSIVIKPLLPKQKILNIPA